MERIYSYDMEYDNVFCGVEVKKNESKIQKDSNLANSTLTTKNSNDISKSIPEHLSSPEDHPGQPQGAECPDPISPSAHLFRSYFYRGIFARLFWSTTHFFSDEQCNEEALQAILRVRPKQMFSCKANEGSHGDWWGRLHSETFTGSCIQLFGCRGRTSLENWKAAAVPLRERCGELKSEGCS